MLIREYYFLFTIFYFYSQKIVSKKIRHIPVCTTQMGSVHTHYVTPIYRQTPCG